MALKGAVECLVSSAAVCSSEQTMTCLSFNVHVLEGINTHTHTHTQSASWRQQSGWKSQGFSFAHVVSNTAMPHVVLSAPRGPEAPLPAAAAASLRPFVSSGKQSWPITAISQRLMCLWASWWWELQVNLTDGEAGVREDLTRSVFSKSRQVREDKCFICTNTLKVLCVVWGKTL